MKQDWDTSAKSEPENEDLNKLFGNLTHAYECASPAEKAAFEEQLKKLNQTVFGDDLSDPEAAWRKVSREKMREFRAGLSPEETQERRSQDAARKRESRRKTKDVFIEAASEENIPWKMWSERPTGTTNPAKWIEANHSDLIGEPEARKKIRLRDPQLIQAYAQWISPSRHPEDDLGLDTRLRLERRGLSAEDALEHKRAQVRSAGRRYREKRKEEEFKPG